MKDKKLLLPITRFDFCFGIDQVAGTDEVGRGSWAGPVVAAAVLIDRSSKIPIGIDDSKKLSTKMKNYLYELIVNNFTYNIAIIDNDIIDSIGVHNASIKAMENAIIGLKNKPNLVLVDGNYRLDIDYKMINIIRGDNKSVAIAAASIIAKVTRDRLMRNLSFDYPNYNWNSNVGYGTKQHFESINKYGINKYHRKSFKPIKQFLKNGMKNE